MCKQRKHLECRPELFSSSSSSTFASLRGSPPELPLLRMPLQLTLQPTLAPLLSAGLVIAASAEGDLGGFGCGDPDGAGRVVWRCCSARWHAAAARGSKALRGARHDADPTRPWGTSLA